MKNFWAKIWVPTLLVALAAMQSFGIDASRALKVKRLSDSLEVNVGIDSTLPITADTTLADVQDSIAGSISPVDSLITVDSLAAGDSIVGADSTAVTDSILPQLTARDTIKAPDSLKEKDPFFYKYYVAIKDSITRMEVRDSLFEAGDTLELAKLDSLYIKDSTEVAIAKFNEWYNSLSKKERRKYDYEQALPAKIEAALRKLEVKDSIKAAKDSIIAATPRILETYAIPDSMHYKRIIMWEHDRRFNDIELKKIDTTYNYHFYDYPFLKEDINATWLGVAGSPVQNFNYFKRKECDNVFFYTPLQAYSYSAESLPMYNTKTPYTELAYWGTLFATKEKEESNIRILTTQNILPELNLTLEYRRYGGKGILRREDTDNRTFVIATNYMGKNYLMHAGYIYNRVKKSENGGITDNFWIRDTTVDAREINVNLVKAETALKKNTVFLDQSYRFPFSFLENLKGRKERKRQAAVRDSIMASGDSVAIAALFEKEAAEAAKAAEADTATVGVKDITSAFIGHSSEYSVFRRKYTDEIGKTDEAGRSFYNNAFYLNPTNSADSMRVMRLDNKVYIRLQPWKSDAIVSKIDVGVGDKFMTYYNFGPNSYLNGNSNIKQNSLYLYAGVQGQYKKYLTWDANGQYTFLGHEINDFGIDANVSFSMYPFRRDKQSPLTISAHFETSLKEPDYYQQNIYSNHFIWNNNFNKISTTKVTAALDIPRWDLSASFGYALLANNLYYDSQAIIRQNTTPMSIMTASLKKNFKLWKFHLDHQVLFQLSSNKDVVPLPMLALNLRYYFQFDVVKNVMQMQIGANAFYNTKWKAPGYNPALGVFFNQNKFEYGNCPYIDAFVNIQWKRASIFVKVVNVNMGWPNKSKDYFSASGYIAPQRAIKFGISWPFYILPGRNKTSSGGTGASGGGVSSGLGGGGGLKTSRR